MTAARVVPSVDGRFVKVVGENGEFAVELPPGWVRIGPFLRDEFDYLDLGDLSEYVNDLLREDLARLSENRRKLMAGEPL